MDSDIKETVEEIVTPPKRGPVMTNQEQNAEYNNGQFDFQYVMWTDESRSTVLASFFDSEGWGRVEAHSANIVPGSMFVKILDSGIDVEKIDEMTDYFAATERDAEIELEEFRAWKNAGKPQPDNEIVIISDEEDEESEKEEIVVQQPEPEIVRVIEEVPVEVPTISVAHMASDFSAEDLFRMKIEVFDIPSVRAASKELKARIRKAKTPVEIFSIIHEANVSFGNG